MGIAGTLPSPAEGVFCLILMNTAMSFNILKDILRSILQVVGINYPPPNSDPCSSVFGSPVVEEPQLQPPPPPPRSREPRKSHTEVYVDKFRIRNPAVRFDTVGKRRRRSRHNCLVCLTRFKSESEVNRLECGHVYHKACLEKWMDYWNTTCPLCRTPLMPDEEEDEDDESIYYF